MVIFDWRGNKRFRVKGFIAALAFIDAGFSKEHKKSSLSMGAADRESLTLRCLWKAVYESPPMKARL